jgi:catechol 2,3-dioxygenase-like lactoylglutathione lyase family enzyme
MILGLDHVAITTQSIDRLLPFYRDLLGLAVVRDICWDGDAVAADRILGLSKTRVRQVKVAGPGVSIEIWEFREPKGRAAQPDRPMCDAGLAHFCFRVGNLQALHDRLVDAGVRFHCPPQKFPGGQSATYARDPDGNIVEFLEPPK